MFSAGARVFSPGAGVSFAGAGGEKPGVCTALILGNEQFNLTHMYPLYKLRFILLKEKYIINM